MSVSDEGGLQVIIPDEEEGTHYKVNMSAGADGTMQVWMQNAAGEVMSMEMGDWEDDEPTVGLFGLTNEVRGSNFAVLVSTFKQFQ